MGFDETDEIENKFSPSSTGFSASEIWNMGKEAANLLGAGTNPVGIAVEEVGDVATAGYEKHKADELKKDAKEKEVIQEVGALGAEIASGEQQGDVSDSLQKKTNS